MILQVHEQRIFQSGAAKQEMAQYVNAQPRKRVCYTPIGKLYLVGEI